MYIYEFRVTPPIDDIIFALLKNKIKINKGLLYQFLISIGYTYPELTAFFKVKYISVVSAISRHNAKERKAPKKDMGYLEYWKYKAIVYQECIKEAIGSDDYSKLHIKFEKPL